MRILVITSQFPLAADPFRGRPILQTIRALGALAEVHVLSPVARYPRWAQPRSYLAHRAQIPTVVEGLTVEHVEYPAFPLLSRPLNGFLCARAIRAATHRYAPDVILSYWLYPDAWAALRVASTLDTPVVVGALGSDICVRDPLSRRLTRAVVRDAQRLLVVSKALGQTAVDEYGALPDQLHVIPNGVDGELFKPRNRAAARQALGVQYDTELIIYVGRLVREKGLRELLDAMRALRQSNPQARAVLIGDGPMRSELETLLQRAPDTPVRLVGALAPELVAQWMTACDLVTLPSWSEGHPNVLVEAQACGRAVVACDVGGISEIVDPDSSILVPPRDSVALRNALQAALSRTWDEQAMADRHSRDWAAVARETLTACKLALSMPRSRS